LVLAVFLFAENYKNLRTERLIKAII